MTISVANTEVGNTLEQWRTRTNEIAHALTTKVVSTDSNTATGNAAISGTFTANTFVGNFEGVQEEIDAVADKAAGDALAFAIALG